MTASLIDRLGVRSRELVSFVGAGGKTSLLLGLGAELVATGSRVLVTTTTKMGRDQVPDWATVCRPGTEVANALRRHEPVFVVGTVSEGKVTGVERDYVDQVFAAAEVDHVLVEADGARGRSLKAPAPHEPVIPAATTLVVVVAGIDAVGGRIADVTHRPDRVAALTGHDREDLLRPADVARVLGHAGGGRKGVPVEARVAVALTKVKPGPGADTAAAIAARLDAVPEIERVVTIDFVSGVGPESEHGG